MKKLIIALVAIVAANYLLVVVAAIGTISVIIVMFRLTALLT